MRFSPESGQGRPLSHQRPGDVLDPGMNLSLFTKVAGAIEAALP
jgi:hypothetical protein